MLVFKYMHLLLGIGHIHVKQTQRITRIELQFRFIPENVNK